MGSLCTGHGGLDLGVLAALGDGRIAWVADPDPHIARILAARMPGIPNLGDLRHIDWAAVEPVDVLVAGWPCQDISAAGKRAGIEKGRRSGLWTDIVAGVRILRPALVVLENVAALRWKGGGLHRVLGDLAEAGYDAAWRSVRAADVGAAHRRERVFLLAWPRDTTHTTHRLLTTLPAARTRSTTDRERDTTCCHRGPGDRVLGHRPSDPDTSATHADGVGCEELHAPDADRWAVAARRGEAAADTASLGHRNGGTRGGNGVPAATVTAGAPAGRPAVVVADTARHGRYERLPGPAGLQGRPDAALRGDQPAHPGHEPQRRRRLVTAPSPDGGPTDNPTVRSSSPSVDWGVYEAAIRRWETVLGRPTPHPTQPGNHRRPVLAPAFVEHLMGLPPGWVTDLPLPRTAQLRALGNGVVPQQAAHAVSLLLHDLAELIHADHRPDTGTEVAAA
ncbi:DNA cytosine methyltransferase [Saccharothrix sp. NEAU-S10]|nr:DNA cytosine methyltransferase [Saccharothrix luteola]